MAAAILVGLGSAYLAFFRNTVTRSEVQHIVETSSPFAVEKAFIHHELTSLDHEVAALEKQHIEGVGEEAAERERIAELRGQVTMLDAAVRALERRAK